jgi:hypothetical protein
MESRLQTMATPGLATGMTTAVGNVAARVVGGAGGGASVSGDGRVGGTGGDGGVGVGGDGCGAGCGLAW